jgi:exopolyphosphatase/guanosine-5'-triphosphate,3'-diphosphate pyrophosphatase
LQTLEQCIERFHIDRDHAYRVKGVALRLFKQVQNQMVLGKIDCEAILMASAMLHETGLHIEYKLFHEHGAYILSHLPMVGYTQQQRAGIKTLVQGHRQEIQLGLFDSFHPEVRKALLMLVRVLRLSCLLSIRRKDNLLADFTLTTADEKWTLTFPEGWLKSHPLIDAELANEKWKQHKVGWALQCF